MRLEDFVWEEAWVSTIYNFCYCIAGWFIIHALINSRRKLGHFLHSNYFGLFSILVTALMIFAIDWAFTLFTYKYHILQFPDPSSFKKYVNMASRGLVLSVLYYFIIHHLNVLKQTQESLLEIEQLKQAKLSANIISLREQLSPHFLFNTLNTLGSISTQEEVKIYVSELASVYRYLLAHSKRDTTTYRDELKFVASYLYIIKVRMEDAVVIDVRVDDSIADTFVPPLTLQLLIENAIKHNVASRSKPLRINIYVENNRFIVVGNNYRPKLYQQHTNGMGLSNIIERYRLLYNSEIIIAEPQDQFIVKLPIITHENTNH